MNRDHLISLTKELVRFPSHVGEPLKIFELVEFIKGYFAQDRLNIAEHVVGGLPALVITNEDTKHPHIMLSGHIDVVPSDAGYTARVEDDKMFGNATMDMKGGVACMMAVMKYFAHQDDAPSIGLMLTSDEETAGNTAEVLLNEESYSTDFCIINEGRPKYDIVIREKGICVFRVTLKGESIHSAYPWKGPNALEEMMKIFLAVKSEFPEPKDEWASSVSITSLRGGKEVNVIPGEAEALFSFRITDEGKWSKENLVELVKQYAPEADIKEVAYGSVFEVDPENDYLVALQKAATEVVGKKIKFGENHGASEARFFSAKGIPTAVLGPVGTNHHSPDEWVSIESLENHFEVLKKFIEEDYAKMKQEKEELERGE